MTNLKDSYTPKEFQEAMKTGIISIGRKGRLKSNNCDKNFLSMLDKEKALISKETVLKTNNVISGQNKKIKNARKCEYDGFKFDSTLELKFYKYLKVKGISFTQQVVYEVQEGFKLEGKKIQAITWRPDFVFEGFVVDTKGFMTEPARLRIKMFMFKYCISVHIFKTENDFGKIYKLLEQHL